MFTGRYEAIPQSGELTQPSTTQSMVATFKADYLSPFRIVPGMEKQKRQAMTDRVNSFRIEAEKGDQGLGQKASNWIAGMAGSILNPISLAGGEAVALGSKVVTPAITAFTGKYLPSQATALLSRPLGEIVGSRAPNFITKETVGSISGKAVSGFAMGTAFSLPGEVANTYNPTTDSFNWQHGIKASAVDGGFGLLLMSAPYLGGILWGKYFRGAADHTKMPEPGAPTPEFNESHIDDAVSKKSLSPQEGQWFKDYFFKNDTNENLAKRATEMLIKDGHPVDSATNQVLFKILHPDDVRNMQSGVADSLASSEMPENMKSLVKDYIGHNSVDRLRGYPTAITDGLRGVTNFVRKRLAKVPEEFVEFHKIMRRLLPERLKEKNPFSQMRLYNGMKKNGRVGLAVPEQIEKRLVQKERINKLKQKNRDYQRELNKTGKKKYQTFIDKNNKKINQLTEKLQPLLTHKQEIEHLRQKLLPDGKVVENFKIKREYHRLMDLTRVRNDARRLMHEVNLRHEYELHEAYATVIDTITKVMRSEFGKLAKPENINDYMRERIQSQVPEFKHIEMAEVKAESKIAREKLESAQEKVKTPEGREEAVKNFDTMAKETKAKQNKEEFEEVKAQYEEFKANEKVLSNLIQCVLGERNG